MAMATVRQNDADAAKQARSLFEGFMQAHAVPRVDAAKPALSCDWLDTAPDGDNFVGSYGRVFDVTVIGRPGDLPQSPRMITLEAALFESGRPILIAPPTPPDQARRERADRLELQHRAGAHHRLRDAVAAPCPPGDGADRRGRNRAGADRRAARPLPQAQRHRRRGGDGGAGKTLDRREVILARAQALGCDLLVKGAYTQSRLRQMIFGGATRHILTHALLPVMMAN